MEEDTNCTGASCAGVNENHEGLKLEQNVEPEPKAEKKGVVRRFAWPAIKVPFYVVFLAVSVIVMLMGLEQMARFALGRSHLANVYPRDFRMVRRDFTKPVSHYDYDFVPGVCIEYNTFKGNRYEYANNAGFRDPRHISLQKPDDEFRIFLMGGSTAYGLGAVGEAAPAMNYYGIPFQETIAHAMEMILNATAPIPGKKIRVYNTAVWGYAYQHHLMRYVTKLRRYKPDLVISLDGANEIAPLCKLTEDWDYFREGQFHNILRHIHAYDQAGLASYLALWLKNNTYLMTYLWGGRDLFQQLHQGVPEGQNAEEVLKAKTHELGGARTALAGVDGGGKAATSELKKKSRLADRNVETVVRVVDDLHSAMENDGVAHLFVLQPWFYLSKKKHTEQEKVLASLDGTRHYYGVPSDKMYQLFIDRISQNAKEKGYFLVDFSEYFDDVSEWVFTDWCHLTAGANYLMAKELANLIKEHFLGQPLTRGDQIDKKDSFFWDFAASSKVLYAPEADVQHNGPRNMLSGYPGQAVYSSRNPSNEDRLEVVLDVGREFPVSRTKLVWADEQSVPEKWAVEVSTDGKTWQTLALGDGEHIDHYSQWPGFEYCAAEPLQARYIKYRPMEDKRVPIKLRCWNVFR